MSFNTNIQLNQSLANHIVSAAVNLTTAGTEAQAKTNGVRHDLLRQDVQNRLTKKLSANRTKKVAGLQSRLNVDEEGLDATESQVQQDGEFRPLYYPISYYQLDEDA